MGFARTYSVALLGISGHLVEVEADISASLPGFVLLGLPDTALSESKDRVRSAAKNSGLPLPAQKITINLTPATLPKTGSAFDLAMLVASLQAAGEVKSSGSTVYLGELGLDGSIRPVPGILPAVKAAVEAGLTDLVVPAANLPEAQLIAGAQVRGYSCLAQLLKDLGVKNPASLRGPRTQKREPETEEKATSPQLPDLKDLAGQAEGRLVLEIAAAGGHHLFLLGTPGAGKTMLAQSLPGILPALDDPSALEVTAIHSLSSPGQRYSQLIRQAPFEAPHHSATAAAILGGGSGLARPGAISRAHRGVLFLDEAPEFQMRVLDSLRQPLESGSIRIDRAKASTSYPARFQLVLAANPCPCGKNLGAGLDCTCTPHQRRNYLSRLSGPLLDRVDLQVTIPALNAAELAAAGQAESSAAVAARVKTAREAQAERLTRWGAQTNAELTGRLLRGPLKLSANLTSPLNQALDRGELSARGYDRVLRTAWTIADLEGLTAPGREQLELALYFRNLQQERKL